jgi:hypothetical protein
MFNIVTTNSIIAAQKRQQQNKGNPKLYPWSFQQIALNTQSLKKDSCFFGMGYKEDLNGKLRK